MHSSPLSPHLPPSRPLCLSHSLAGSPSQRAESAHHHVEHAAGRCVQWARESLISARDRGVGLSSGLECSKTEVELYPDLHVLWHTASCGGVVVESLWRLSMALGWLTLPTTPTSSTFMLCGGLCLPICTRVARPQRCLLKAGRRAGLCANSYRRRSRVETVGKCYST